MATRASTSSFGGTATSQRTGRRISFSRMLAWAVLILAVFLTLFPFWWVIRTAFSTSRQIFVEPTNLAPVGFTWVNFQRVLGLTDTATAIAAGGTGQSINFWLYLQNSVVVAVMLVCGQIFFSALAAYAFARLNFPLRDKIFFLFLAALMLPGIVTLIPNYILIRRLNLLNTYWGIVAPGFLMSPFAIFFLRQFFLGINREVEEAAKIDGASLFGIFWRIVLPISGPPIATLAILVFITAWNDYLWPLIIAPDENARVLTVALGVFRSQTPQGAPDWTGLMAATILSMLPTFVMFAILGRRVINSIQFSGIK